MTSLRRFRSKVPIQSILKASFHEHEIDDRYLDSPYYIAPTDKVGQEAFAVIRDAIREKGMVAMGRVVLSRRERVVMLEAFDKGLLAVTLRYAYEVRSQNEYFEDIQDIKLPAEMRQLAMHIIELRKLITSIPRNSRIIMRLRWSNYCRKSKRVEPSSQSRILSRPKVVSSTSWML